jgi:hypothetical protein
MKSTSRYFTSACSLLLIVFMLGLLACKSRSYQGIISSSPDDKNSFTCDLETFEPLPGIVPEPEGIPLFRPGEKVPELKNENFEYATHFLPSDMKSICEMNRVYKKKS